jgi:predicted nucleic acid-binding protein
MSGGDVHFDTSVVVRLLVAMPINQFRAASRYLSDLREAGVSAYVSDLALAEAYFALQTFYGFTKVQALAALAELVRLPGITVTPHARAVLDLPNLATAKPGFADRLIHGTANAAGQTLVTFEKAAKKLPATLVLEG